MTYTQFDNLTQLMGTITTDSITSRTILDDPQVKAVLFGFDAGQSLSEHSAAQAATLHILEGEATVTLGDDTFEAGPGYWAHMPPRLSHSIQAKTPLVMLLLLIKAG